MTNSYQIRPALAKDHQDIANLIFFERHVHRHLDWRHPTDWLGSPFYWVLEKNSRIVAVLACPQDKKDVIWLRLFAHAARIPALEAWDILWENAKKELAEEGDVKVASISLKGWMKNLLQLSGFVQDEQILMLSWAKEREPEWSLPEGVTIRSMTEADLSQVAEVDAAAFKPLWQNLPPMLEQAYSQAVVATVAVATEGIIGYQISTHSPFGAHLARLAIHPKIQRRGIASAILGDLLKKLLKKNIKQLSVNTQSKNKRSIALYTKNGFKPTEEEYPLFTFQIYKNGQGKEA